MVWSEDYLETYRDFVEDWILDIELIRVAVKKIFKIAGNLKGRDSNQ